jgi:hypothetical protein
VEAREINPPENESPVHWRLVTTEPIDTNDEVAAVIDAYRRRWIVEEFFKALKTGCRYQQLQLESARALLIALSIETAIAWRMLLLRWLAHHEPEAPARAACFLRKSPSKQQCSKLPLSQDTSKTTGHQDGSFYDVGLTSCSLSTVDGTLPLRPVPRCDQ